MRYGSGLSKWVSRFYSGNGLCASHSNKSCPTYFYIAVSFLTADLSITRRGHQFIEISTTHRHRFRLGHQPTKNRQTHQPSGVLDLQTIPTKLRFALFNKGQHALLTVHRSYLVGDSTCFQLHLSFQTLTEAAINRRLTWHRPRWVLGPYQ